MNKKKAFTMVELLATIVILGILAVTIVLSIRFVINRSVKKYYDNQREMIVLAAKNYYSDNRSKLPKDIGQINEVTLKELVDQKYISPVKDKNGNLCVYESEEKKSKVIVQKIGKNKYNYNGYLYCSGNESGILDNEAPKIVLTPEEKLDAVSDVKVKIKITDNVEVMSYKYVIYKNSQVIKDVGFKKYKGVEEINLDDNGSYNIIVSAYDTSGNFSKEEGNYKIEVLDSDCSQIDVIASASDEEIDSSSWTNASSVSVNVNIKTDTIQYWELNDSIVNGDVTSKKIKVNKTEDKIRSFELEEEGLHTLILKAYNSRGESCERKVIYGIDRTAPTVPTVTFKKWATNAESSRPTVDNYTTLSNYTVGSWSNKKIYTRASGSTDNLTKVTYYYTTTGATTTETDKKASSRNIEASGTSYIKYKACDEAGNCSAYTTNYQVKVDTVAPTVPTVVFKKWSDNSTAPTSSNYTSLSNYAVGSWSNKKIYTRASSTDGHSGGITYYYTTTGATTNATDNSGVARNIEANGSSTIKYKACDDAGNCSAYTAAYSVKVDTVAPTVPTLTFKKYSDNDTDPTMDNYQSLSGYTTGNWSNKNIFIVPKSSDSHSGIASYRATTTGATTNVTDAVHTYKVIKANGTSYIKYRTCDNAGNCSAYTSNYTVKIDKAAPKLSSWSHSAGPHNNNSGITVSLTCSDSHSGVNSYSSTGIKVSSPTSSSGKKVTISCTDKAGNKASFSRTFKVKYKSRDSACGTETVTSSACSSANSRKCTSWKCSSWSTYLKDLCSACPNNSVGKDSKTEYRNCREDTSSSCVGGNTQYQKRTCTCSQYKCTLYKSCYHY